MPKNARDRKATIAARKKFTSGCGKPTDHWQELGAVATINGVGFFDIPHTQKPHALNFAELHQLFEGAEPVAGAAALRPGRARSVAAQLGLACLDQTWVRLRT